MFCNKIIYPCYNLIILKLDYDIINKVFLSRTKIFDFTWSLKINGNDVNIISTDFYKGDIILALDLDDEEIKYPITIEYVLSLKHILEYFRHRLNLEYGETRYIKETWKSNGSSELTLVESNYDDDSYNRIFKPLLLEVEEQHLAEKLAIKQSEYKRDEKEDNIIDVDFVEITGFLE